MKHGRHKKHHSWKLGAAAAALTCALIGGGTTLAYATQIKTINLVVDGASRQVKTATGQVSELLAELQLNVGEYDQVSPSLDTQLSSGTQVQVARATVQVVDKDGVPAVTWQLASDNGTWEVPVFIDGQQVAQRINLDASARAALKSAGIELSPLDRVVVGESAGQVAVFVSRVSRTVEQSDQSTAAPVEKISDDQLDSGQEVVESQGADGQIKTTVFSESIDGQAVFTSDTVQQVLSEAQPKVVRVGTKVSTTTSSSAASQADSSGGGYVTPSGEAQEIAHTKVLEIGWGEDQFACLVQLWNRESGWNTHAANSSGAYGIPQALPGSKMAQFGSDWRDNPTTQINWGLSYIQGRYGNPCTAWSHFLSKNWY